MLLGRKEGEKANKESKGRVLLGKSNVGVIRKEGMKEGTRKGSWRETEEGIRKNE